MSKKKLSFYDRMDDLSDDLHGISEMLFLIGEDSIGKYDTYGMLAFLGRKLEKTRKDMMKTVEAYMAKKSGKKEA